jgi:hypothetical protein
MGGPGPAWHVDPWGVAGARWWDGAAWTGQTTGRPAAGAALFSELPTVSTVLYVAAGTLMEPYRNPLLRFQVPGGTTVRADELVRVVFAAVFWSLREQGAIWLSTYTEAKRRRPSKRARVGLAHPVERPWLEGAVVRALTEAGEAVELRTVVQPLLGLAAAVEGPVHPGNLMWAPHLEGIEAGLLSAPSKKLGTHSKVKLEPDAASAAGGRAKALYREWQHFVGTEPELATVLQDDCYEVFGWLNAG